jgi:hypothetical protein
LDYSIEVDDKSNYRYELADAITESDAEIPIDKLSKETIDTEENFQKIM